MLTNILKILSISALAAGAAFAQNSDLGLLLGGVVRVRSHVEPNRIESSVTGAGQINYAAQLHETTAGQLYLEIPVLMTGGSRATITSRTVTGFSGGAVFLTPGLRWRFTPANRVSFYADAGGGIAVFHGSSAVVGNGIISASNGSTATGALGFGGGLDFRITRLISFRIEGRDGLTRGNVDGATHHAFLMFGLGFHF
jgi:hypothetical protein